MSESSNELTWRQLEQITVEGPADEASLTLDGDAAALRESWLAFQKLLDSSEPEFDAAALLERLRSQKVETKPSATGRKSRWGRWLGLVAMAASLVIGLIAWRTAHNSQVDRDVANSETSEIPLPTTESPAANAYAWDDAWDDQIADVDERMIHAGRDWRGYDPRYSALDERLQVLSESWKEEPL